jgi:hypothetical protein
MGHTTSSSKLFHNISENISSSLASSISYSAIIASSGRVIQGCIFTFQSVCILCLSTSKFICEIQYWRIQRPHEHKADVLPTSIGTSHVEIYEPAM